METGSYMLALSDDLIHFIASFANSVSGHALLVVVCRRLFNVFHARFCTGLLFGTTTFDEQHELDRKLSLMRQLATFHALNPNISHLVRTHVTRSFAIRLVDQVIYENILDPTVHQFITAFQLKIFEEIVPGIYHDWRNAHTSARPAFARKTLYSLFGVDLQASRNINMDVLPDIDRLLRDAVEETRPLPRSRRCFEPLFEKDLVIVHGRNSVLPSVPKILAVLFGDPAEHLKDPEILWKLARLGFRIPVRTYLSHVNIAPDQFAQVVPYLSLWTDRATYMGLDWIMRYRYELLPILFRWCPMHDWMLAQIQIILGNMLSRREFQPVRDLCKGIGRAMLEEPSFPSLCLEWAIQKNAPRELLDDLLDYPAERFVNFKVESMQVPDLRTLLYVQGRIKSKLSQLVTHPSE